MEKNRFAKLFEFEDIGQVLVLRKTDDNDKPCVRYICQPEADGIGTCSITVPFVDSDNGNAQADKAFEAVDEEAARAAFQTLTEVGRSMSLSKKDHDVDPLIDRLIDQVIDLLPPSMRKNGQMELKFSEFRRELEVSFRQVLDRAGV